MIFESSHIAPVRRRIFVVIRFLSEPYRPCKASHICSNMIFDYGHTDPVRRRIFVVIRFLSEPYRPRMASYVCERILLDLKITHWHVISALPYMRTPIRTHSRWSKVVGEIAAKCVAIFISSLFVYFQKKSAQHIYSTSPFAT